MHKLVISDVDFSDVLPFWENKLWPNRSSAIETHSAQTWPYDNSQPSIDMSIFSYNATFLGVFASDKLVGVCSGHASSPDHYRMRGFWIDPEYRGMGGHVLMLDRLESLALDAGCVMAWTVPRDTIVHHYIRRGYRTVGEYFETETHPRNIYVIKYL